MATPQLLLALYPDLLWHQGTFRSGMGLLASDLGILTVDSIAVVEEEVARRRQRGEYVSTRRLVHKALLPGFINTHSHAFQRAIRGRTEYPATGGSQQENFWSWRGLMYDAATRLEPMDVEAVAQAVFVEMVKAGITRVGEFHYLHHRPDGTLYEDPDELTNRILRAAASAGIKVTLLRSFYQRQGVGRPQPEGAQRIFCDPSVEFYLETLERLRKRGIQVGVTPHSVRAVTRENLAILVDYAHKNNLPFHIHASEQPREIEECLQEHGRRPVELLADLDALRDKTTLVHAVHVNEGEIRAIGEAGVSIASCPTTERNLGDGIVPAAALLQAGAFFTFGTDSQCQICLPEDARQLEYHLRLKNLQRCLMFQDQVSAGRTFLQMLTVNGARSLGQKQEGRLEVGCSSNFFSLNLEHLSLAGASADSLPLDIVFSFENSAVADVWVEAQEVVSDGYHRAEKQALRNLARVFKKLRGG